MTSDINPWVETPARVEAVTTVETPARVEAATTVETPGGWRRPPG
jgi:hypothetical protein